MKWLWISGWAVPPDWLAAQASAAWPGDSHAAISPSAAAAASFDDFDAIGGYSLGALWLLRHQGTIPLHAKVRLFAPFFAFTAEAGLGGRIPRAQLRQQRRHLRREPAAAIAEFARHAGLPELPLPSPARAAELGAELDRELQWLEEWNAPGPPPSHWQGWVGGADPLLDAGRLARLWPNLRVVPDAGHAPGPLFHAAVHPA